MWEAREPGSIIRAAERAAEARNYKAAETLLREAARLQEASLGPRHPDLANTLNNLGIVCEMTDKPDDAEQYFRRAVSIARTSLPPDHPFVATSQQNLRDFCEARGKKVDTPAPMPEVPKPAQQRSKPAQDLPKPAQELPNPAQKLLMPAPEIRKPAQDLPKPAQEVTAANDAEPEEAPQLSSERLFYRVALGALGPIAMLMVVLAAGLPRLWPPEPTAPIPAVAVDLPKVVAAPPEPAPVEPTPTAPEETTPPPPTTKASNDEVGDASTSDRTAESTPARPEVVLAKLCAELDDWLCDPADHPVPSGPLFFYTQVKSASATTVQHRWYKDDHLRQTVTLHVQANRAGYRTFSRTFMTSESAGSWRVELRGEDGALLDEERFTVR
jgi:Protein of unknown function (DUF2914)/Tetratricopeptide repeat